MEIAHRPPPKQHIAAVELQDVQSHRKTRLDLHPGVNIITGQNDTGKSTIIRALRSVIENRPPGSELISWLIKKPRTAVRVFLDDGTIIERVVKPKNSYVIHHPDGTEHTLKALRSAVPTEVTDILRMDASNLQLQFDPHYMIGQSGGAVARELNEVTGLSLVSYLFAEINAAVATTTEVLAQDTKDLADTEKELDALAVYVPIQQDVVEAEKVNDYITAKQLEESRLAALIHRIGDVNSRVAADEQRLDSVEKASTPLRTHLADLVTDREQQQSIANVLLRIGITTAAIANARQIQQSLPDLDRFADVIQSVSALQKNTRWLDNALDRLEALSRSSERQQAIQHYFDKAVENLQNIISSVVDANSRMVGIGNVVHKCKTARADVDTSRNAATAALDAYNKLVDEYQICPLCGTGKLTKMEMT